MTDGFALYEDLRVCFGALERLMPAVASYYARRKQRGVPMTGHLFERRVQGAPRQASASY